MKIFIDPGHGGHDPGAVGNGMRESDIALEVSHLLAEKLSEATIGLTDTTTSLTGATTSRPSATLEVRLSRTTDTALGINDRWRMANDWNADYFISIHVNAGRGTGGETFIAATKSTCPTNGPPNHVFAEIVNNTYCNAMGLRNRGIKLDTQTAVGSLGVLRHSHMPTILVELAFIDAPLGAPDVTILQERRADMASALAKGILAYLGLNWDAEGGVPYEATKESGDTKQPVSDAAHGVRTNYPISESNIQAMADLGVMNSPEHCAV